MTTQSFNARRRRRGKGARTGAPATAAALLLLVAVPAWANPDGGVVVRGEAAITHAPGEVVVHQRSGKTVVNWNGFSVEDGEVTRFKQPGKDSIALNRVVGKNASRIDGKLQADGHVWVVNRNGVTVGPKGRVDATGFLATTADIDDNDFMAGNHRFAKPSPNPNAKVINQGTISLGAQGFGALVAPHARNDGVIEGRLAKVVIGGAETFTLDLYGDGLIQFDATSKVKQRPEGVSALAVNTGTITADGGTVLITATAAAGVVEDVINLGGRVQAKSFAASPGRIILRGGDEGVVRVTGTLDVSGAEPVAKGGRVDIRGKRVLLTETARVKASGPAGGGEVLIGGDQSGQGPGPNAEDTVVMAGAEVSADAEVAGDGGRVIVYADKTAKVYGSLSARGGPQSGAGGFVETSGKGWLDVQVTPDVVAPNGAGGTWLIDPADLTVDTGPNANLADTEGDPRIFSPTGESAVLNSDLLAAALSQGTNVSITTIGSVGSGLQFGDITFAAKVLASDSQTGSLSVSAQGGVYFNSTLDLSGNLVVSSIDGPIQEGPSGSLIVGGTSSFDAGANPITLENPDNAFSDTVSLSNRSDPVTSADYPVSLVNGGNLTLHEVAVGGNLAVKVVDGSIDQTELGSVEVDGNSTFTATAGYIGLFNDSNDFIGPVTLTAREYAVLSDTNDLQVGTTVTEGLEGFGADLSAGGALTLDVSDIAGALWARAHDHIIDTGTLLVGGPAVFTTRNDNDASIILEDSNSQFGSLLAETLDTDYAVADGTISIRQSGAMSIEHFATLGSARFEAASFSHIGDFDPIDPEAPTAQAHDLFLVATAAGIELPFIQLDGALGVQAAGAITQVGALRVGGAAAFDAAGHTITLTATGNDLTGAVSLTNSGPNAAQLFNSGALHLVATHVGGDLSVTALGAISGGGLTVGGAANFATRNDAGAAITLNAGASQFGTVSARSLDAQGSATRGGAISILQSGAMTIVGVQTTGTATLKAGTIAGLGVISNVTNLSLTATVGGIVLPAFTLTGYLTAVAAGPITQGGALRVGGTSNFNAAAGAITLSDPGNALTGVVSLTNSGPNPVNLVNGRALFLGASSLGSGTATFAGSPTYLGADITTAGGPLRFQDPVVLTANVALDTTNRGSAPVGAAIDLVSVDADGVVAGTDGASAIIDRTLNLNAGSGGAINVTGAIGAAGALAGLTIANSGGATFTGPVSVTTGAGLVVLTGTAAGQRIRFAGGLNATTLTADAQGYDLRLGGLSTLAADTHLSNTGLLILDDGAAALFQGGLDHTSGSSHLGGTLRTLGQPLDLGAVTLIGNASIDTTNSRAAATGASIHLASVDADATANVRTLALDAGTGGTIEVAGAIGATGALAGLTVIDSNGATFGGPARVTAGSGAVTLTDTSAGQTIRFSNGLTATTLATSAQGYGLALLGTANRLDTASTFNNLGSLTLGGAAGDTLTFVGGLTANAPGAVNLAGTLTTLGSTLAFGRPVTLIGDTTLAAGTGDIRLAAVDGAHTLTLNSAGTTRLTGTIGGQTRIRSLTTDAPGSTDLGADISAQGNSLIFNDPVVLRANLVLTDEGAITFAQTLDGPFDLTLEARGQVRVQGAVGADAPLGTLTLADSAGASFAAITAQRLNLAGTAGAITLTGVFDLGTLITAASGYDLALLGGGIVTGQTATSFLNTGALTLGDGAADSTVFSGGLTATAPRTVNLAGTISSATGPISLGAGTLTAATILNSGGGAVALASLAGGAQNLTLGGATTVLGAVTNLGSGAGPALTVASGVTGLVWFQGSLGANSGLAALAGSSLRFDGDVTLGNGDTATSLLGTVQLDGLNFSGFDGLSFGATRLSGGPVTLNSNGGNSALASLIGGGQNLTLAAGIGAGTTTVTGPVSDLGSGTGPVLTVANGVTGLVWFQGPLGGNAGLVALADSSRLRFDGDVTLGNGDTATGLPGSVQLDGLSFSGFDGLSFGATRLSGAPVTLNSNGGNIALASLIGGGQNLTLAAGIGAGTTTVTGPVSDLGSGTGPALTVANGVTGLVRFQGPLGANAGLVALADSSLRFDGDVTLGNGDTATSLLGTVQLDGLSFSGFDGLSFGATRLSGGPVTLNSNGGNIALASLIGGGQNLTLAAGIGAGTTTVAGPVSDLGSGTGPVLTVANGVTGLVRFQGPLGGNAGLVALADSSRLRFDGDVTLGNGDTATSLPGTVTLDGLAFSGNDGISLGATAVTGTSTVDANGSALALGAVTLSDGVTLTLGTGSADPIRVASVTGPAVAVLPSNLTFNTTGSITVIGPVALDHGALTVTQSGGATFGGAVHATDVTLTDTSGAIAFNAALTADTLTTENQDYSVALNAGGNLTNLVAFRNTGAVTLNGAVGGLTFGAGVATAGNASNPSGTNLAGTLVSTQGPLTLGAVTLTAATSLDSGGGAITLASLVGGGQNLTLAAGVGAGTTTVAGPVSDLGSGTGAALTVANGVTGLVWFQGPLGGNAGLVALADSSSLRFDGDVTLGNGNTATSLLGTVQLDGLNFSGFDGLSFGATRLSGGPVTLNSNGGNSALASLIGGGQNLTLAAGIGAGTTTVAGPVSDLGSGTGPALTVASGVTGLVWFQGSLGANAGLAALAGSSLRFDGDVTLGNGDTATSLLGTVQLDGLNFSGFDGLSFGATRLSGGPVTLNSNGGNSALASLIGGGQNLTLAAGIGAGTTTVAGPVSDLGSGTGPALTVASGVTGLVWFQGSLGANAGLAALAGSSLRFDGDVTLGNGDTATSLLGTVQLDGLNFSGFDGLIFGATRLSGGPVTLNSNRGNSALASLIGGGQNLTLAAGIGAGTTTVAGPVSDLGSGAGPALTVASGVTGLVWFQGPLGGNAGLVALADSSRLRFDGDVTLGNGDTATSLPGSVQLDGLNFSGFGGLTLGATTLSGGPVALDSNGGNLRLAALAGGAQNLTLTAGIAGGTTTVTGNVGDLGTGTGAALTVGDGVTGLVWFQGSLGGNAGLVALADTSHLRFDGDVTLADGDTGTSLPGGVQLDGLSLSVHDGLTLGLTWVSADTTVNGNGSALDLGVTTLADGVTLTLGTGSADSIAVASVSGTAGLDASHLTFNSTRAISVGDIGNDIGTLSVANSGGASFAGITAQTLTLVDTTGTITVTDAFSLGTLDTATAAFDLALLGGGAVAGSAPTRFNNTGRLTLGDAAGDHFSFAAGLIAIPGAISLAGSISTIDAVLTLTPVVTLTANLVLSSGSGDIRLAAVDGNHSLTLDSAGTTWLTGIIGGLTPLQSLTTDAPGSTHLAADISAQGNSLTFDDWVYLDQNVVLRDRGDITFMQGIDNHYDLTLATDGQVLIQGPVGSLTPLQTLTLQHSTGALLTAVTADTLDLAGTSGAIAIVGNLNLGTLSTGGDYDLSLLGGLNTVAAAVTFANTGGLTLGGQAAAIATFVGGVRVAGPSSLTLAGSIRAPDQPITLSGIMLLSADTMLDTTGSVVGPGDGAITLAGTLDGPSSMDSVGGPGATLTLVAGTGDLTQGAVIGGSRPLRSLTADGQDLTLSGPVTVTEGLALSALGAIDGAGLLTAANLTLDAQTGIGAGTRLALATPLILARSTAGTIALGNTRAGAATVSSVTTGGNGDILIGQTGGGALSVAQAGTAAGAIRLRSSAGLTTGAITAGGGGAIDYGAGAAGIRIEGPTSAPGGAVVIQTPGALATGPGGSISAQALRILDAAMVGAASQPLQTTVAALTLTNVGATFLRNAGSLLVNDSTLTGGLDLGTLGDLTLMGINTPGQVVTLTAGGAIIDGNGTALNLIADTLNVQSGAGIGLLDWLGLAVGTLNAASQSGNIDIASSRTSTLTLSGLAADAGFIRVATGGPLIIGGSVRAGGLVELTTAGLLAVNAPVSGGTLTLGGGTIAFGPFGALTSKGTLSATALTGDLSMSDGTLVQAGGAVTLSAAGNVALGRVTAGANPISVTARAGAILDHTAAEGPGNENLVGGDLSLEAATGIGTAGAAGDLDTAAARLDARTTGAGGIYIDETDALQLGNQAALTTGGPGADIIVTAVGPLTIARDIRVSGSGDVWLTTAGYYGDLLVNANVETATGDIALISGAGIQRSGAAVLRNTVFDQGTVSLCAEEGIGTEAAPILLDAAVVAAFSAGRNGNSGIWLTQVEGLQGSLTFGPTPCPCANQGPPRTAAPTLPAPIAAAPPAAAQEPPPTTTPPTTTLMTRGFVTANWATIRGGWAALAPAWAQKLTPLRFQAFTLADEFAVPDFGSIEESELLYLSGGNLDLWGPSAQADAERRRREEQETADATRSAP